MHARECINDVLSLSFNLYLQNGLTDLDPKLWHFPKNNISSIFDLFKFNSIQEYKFLIK